MVQQSRKPQILSLPLWKPWNSYSMLVSWLTKTQPIWGTLGGSCDLAVCWCTCCAAGLCSYTWIVVLVGLAAPIPWCARPWLTCVTFLLTECLELHWVVHCLSVVGATPTTRQAACCIWTDLVVLTWTKSCICHHNLKVSQEATISTEECYTLPLECGYNYFICHFLFQDTYINLFPFCPLHQALYNWPHKKFNDLFFSATFHYLCMVSSAN